MIIKINTVTTVHNKIKNYESMVFGEQNYYEVLTAYVDSGTTKLGQNLRSLGVS